MTVPGRVAAAGLLLSLDPPTWFLRHARAVAEVAAWLGKRLEACGADVDRRLVESAALLHDVDKLIPAGHPAKQLPHGEAGAAWLAAHGYPELGPAVGNHPVTRLADRTAVRAWLGSASPEELVVAYADKRAGQRLVSLDARFRSWERRYPGAWPGEPPGLVRAHAGMLERHVCAMAGIEPAEVRRLRWTRAALARAAALRAGRP